MVERTRANSPFFTCHEYLFGGGGVGVRGGGVPGMLCRMKNSGQLSIFHPHLFPQPLPPVTHLINESVFTCLFMECLEWARKKKRREMHG